MKETIIEIDGYPEYRPVVRYYCPEEWSTFGVDIRKILENRRSLTKDEEDAFKRNSMIVLTSDKGVEYIDPETLISLNLSTYSHPEAIREEVIRKVIPSGSRQGA